MPLIEIWAETIHECYDTEAFWNEMRH